MTHQAVRASTALYGVAGQPVRHSLSPVLHNGWIADHGLDAVYVAFEIDEPDFETALAGLRAAGAQGLNVTLPFKARALACAAAASVRSVEAGAANTMTASPAGWSADSTDGPGFVADLDLRAPGWRDVPGPMVVIGAGGAGRSLLHALRTARPVAGLHLANRSPERAEQARLGLDGVTVFSFDALPAALAGAGLVVNCTSRGLRGIDPLEPDFNGLHADATVYDTVYSPRRTAFLAAASRHRTLDGLGMLVGQAAISFERWFGIQPDIEAGLARLEASLEAQA